MDKFKNTGFFSDIFMKKVFKDTKFIKIVGIYMPIHKIGN